MRYASYLETHGPLRKKKSQKKKKMSNMIFDSIIALSKIVLLIDFSTNWRWLARFLIITADKCVYI